MHKSGRVARRLGLALVFVAGLAGAALADTGNADVPASDVYSVAATLVPGAGGAEVCATDRGDGHIDFRVGFGTDLRLCVNGVDAGPYDPNATYLVTVDCHKVCGQWLATTHVSNVSTGLVVFHQDSQPVGGADEVAVEGEQLIQFAVQ